MKQRHHRRVQRGEARDLVGHDGADVVRFAREHFLNGRQSAFGLDGVVVRGQIFVGTAAAVAVTVGVDDRGLIAATSW